jgi:hypothetical protein
MVGGYRAKRVSVLPGANAQQQKRPKIPGMLFWTLKREKSARKMGVFVTANFQYIVRDKEAIGFLLSAGPKGVRAFDADGRSIGLFEDEHRAAKAVYEQTAPNSIVSP